MRQMFRNIFSAIATLFGAVERGANALDSCAKWAEAEAEALEQEAAMERQARIQNLQAELKEVA